MVCAWRGLEPRIIANVPVASAFERVPIRVIRGQIFQVVVPNVPVGELVIIPSYSWLVLVLLLDPFPVRDERPAGTTETRRRGAGRVAAAVFDRG